MPRALATPLVLALIGGCASDGHELDTAYSCTVRSSFPYNYPQAETHPGDPMLELYDTMRIAEVWDRGHTGDGRDIYILDAEFIAPVNPSSIGTSYHTPGFHINETVGCGILYPCKFVHEFAPMSIDELPQAASSSEYPHGTWVAQVAAGGDRDIDVCADSGTFAGIAPSATAHYFSVPGKGYTVDGPVKEEGPGGVVKQAIEHIEATEGLSGSVVAVDYVAHSWEEGEVVGDDDVNLLVRAVSYARRKGAVVVISSKYFGADTDPPNPAVVDAVERVLDAGGVVAAPYFESQIHVWDEGESDYQGSLEVFQRLVRPYNRFDSNAVPATAGLIADLWEANPSLDVRDFAEILANASHHPASTDVGTKVPLDAVVALELALAR